MRGHLRQRARGSWQITVELGRDILTGKRRQHVETVRGSKTAAQARVAELITEISRGGYVKPPRELLVSDYLRGWLRDYVEMNCATKTLESYRALIEKHIIPELGNIRLEKLEPRHLQTLYSRKKEAGLGTRTVRYLYSLMSEALAHAVKTGLLYRNVARATDPPRIEHKATPIMTTEQLWKFLETAKETQYYPLFYLLLHTGIRRGEALALRWSHVDMGAPSLGMSAYISISESFSKIGGRPITKEPKSASGKRRVALPPSLVLVLIQHRKSQEALRVSLGGVLKESDYVFCHPNGVPMDPSTVSHAFAKTLRRAGLPPIPLHGLRHSHATFLLQAGVHPKIVQERLGHSSIRVTLDTYSHVVGGLQEAAAQKFDDFLAEKDNTGKDVGKMLAR